jgi:hypothetical protein
MPLKCRGVVTVKNLLIKPDFMEKFEKLNRDEMKNVKGGQPIPPQCNVGALCHGADNQGHILTCTCDANCNCTEGNAGAINGCNLN